jgi:hypothetical protein
MKRLIFLLIVFAFILFGTKIHAQTGQTYKSNGTTYYFNKTYETTGKPKVERSSAARKEFLKSRGYTKVPYGYQIDHIKPLSEGGTDTPNNMQLIPKGQHKSKTANERSRNSVNSKYITPSYKSSSTYKRSNSYSAPSYSNGSGKNIYTGPKGGQYYINSNGNKTYVKKK